MRWTCSLHIQRVLFRRQAKHELADKRLEDRKEYDLSKYETKPKEDWKLYLTDNLKYNQSKGDATQLYHAETYKRSMAIGEELDKRKEAVSRAARELHHEQVRGSCDAHDHYPKAHRSHISQSLQRFLAYYSHISQSF
jgi:hypothetical protein